MSGTAITAITKEGVQRIDPARKIPGMAPGGSQPVVPHVVSFQAMAWSGARVYRPSDEALRDSLENARYMRNDAGVMECVEQRQRSTALLDWHIEVDDEDDPRQAELRDAVTRLLERIPYFTKYRECLLGAIWYGRYAVENLYRWQWIDGRKYVGVAQWRPIHGDKLVWKFLSGDGDNNGDHLEEERLGIRVGGGQTGKQDGRWRREHQERIEPTDWGLAYFLQPWERDLLTVHQHIIEDGEYEDPLSAGRIHGVGIRSRIYWTWYQKQEALAWLMEFLERSGFGIEIWYYPYGNAEAEEKARTAAQERIGQGRNIILVPRPVGAEGLAYGVERIEPGMSGAQALKDILTEYFGHQIKRYILGQTLTTEAHATGLGSNLASIHLDTPGVGPPGAGPVGDRDRLARRGGQAGRLATGLGDGGQTAGEGRDGTDRRGGARRRGPRAGESATCPAHGRRGRAECRRISARLFLRLGPDGHAALQHRRPAGRRHQVGKRPPVRAARRTLATGGRGRGTFGPGSAAAAENRRHATYARRHTSTGYRSIRNTSASKRTKTPVGAVSNNRRTGSKANSASYRVQLCWLFPCG